MKKLLLVIIVVFTFSLFPADTKNNKDDFVVPKYQSIAIGQLSLAYRLISLSTSLTIAKAVNDEYIVSILDNIVSTIKNCSDIVSAKDSKKDELSNLIIEAIDYFIKCSANVKDYTTLHSYENLQKVRSCIDRSGKYIDDLTELHNKNINKSMKKN